MRKGVFLQILKHRGRYYIVAAVQTPHGVGVFQHKACHFNRNYVQAILTKYLRPESWSSQEVITESEWVPANVALRVRLHGRVNRMAYEKYHEEERKRMYKEGQVLVVQHSRRLARRKKDEQTKSNRTSCGSYVAQHSDEMARGGIGCNRSDSSGSSSNGAISWADAKVAKLRGWKNGSSRKKNKKKISR